MATVTPNFNFPVPQSTDLVKDGATAIASLGTSIDTQFVDLKGGTTGQVLAKASGTDLDYTWTTPQVGDITAVTAGTGITGGGTSGAVTVSFDQANYGGGQFSAGKNKIINGDFRFNQRAFTSTTTSATYGFDRWRCTLSGGTVTYSAQTFTAGTAPVSGYEGINYARLVTTSQSASSDRAVLNQLIEDVRTLSGQTVTVSFWAQAGTGTPNINVVLNQNFGSGGSSSVNAPTPTAQAISTSWTRYSFTIANPSVSGKTITADSRLNLQIYVSDGGDQSTGVGAQNNTFNIWGVQIEAGSTATPFQTATGTIQAELAACQRYYIRQGGDTNFQTFATGYGASTTTAVTTMVLPVKMRVAPTSVDFSTIRVHNTSAGWAITAVAIDTNFSSSYQAVVTSTIGSASLTIANGYIVGGNNSSSAYLGFSAEL